MNIKLKREIIGFLVAPFLPVLFFAAHDLIFYPKDPFFGLLVVFLLMFAYLATIILGLPVHIYLKKTGKHNLLTYLLCGAAIGLFTGFLEYDSYALTRSFYLCLTGTIYGVMSIAIFWFIAVKPKS